RVPRSFDPPDLDVLQGLLDRLIGVAGVRDHRSYTTRDRRHGLGRRGDAVLARAHMLVIGLVDAGTDTGDLAEALPAHPGPGGGARHTVNSAARASPRLAKLPNPP